MAVPTTSLISWLTGLGWDTDQERGAPLVPGPYVLEEPDRLVTLTAVPGPGYIIEGAADASAFQARVRGPQDDPGEAERLAYALDSLIFSAPFPVTLTDGTVLIHVHRLGSAPTPLAPGPDDGLRFELTCTYLAYAGTR